jgi:Uma2 family endonuclease
MSVDEYLEGERLSDIKNELIDGQIFAMADASINHNRICSNVIAEFVNHLKNSTCEPFAADMKVKVGENLYYPDVIVDCNDNDENEYYRTSPIIIVEVLSKTTYKIDKTLKKREYINLPSLQEYVLIEQDVAAIEVLRKRANWFPEHYFLGDEITFESINLTLPVEDVYDRVKNENVQDFIKQKSPLKI